MTTQAQAATVRQEIVVEAPVDRAFRVFTEQMDKIKPREHNMLGVDIAETVFEPRAGGRIYDRGTDGSECEWAQRDRLRAARPRRVQLERQSALAGRDGPREAQRSRGALHRRRP